MKTQKSQPEVLAGAKDPVSKGFNSILEQAEERSSQPEYRTVKIIKSEEQKEKKDEKSEHSHITHKT